MVSEACFNGACSHACSPRLSGMFLLASRKSDATSSDMMRGWISHRAEGNGKEMARATATKGGKTAEKTETLAHLQSLNEVRNLCVFSLSFLIDLPFAHAVERRKPTKKTNSCWCAYRWDSSVRELLPNAETSDAKDHQTVFKRGCISMCCLKHATAAFWGLLCHVEEREKPRLEHSSRQQER